MKRRSAERGDRNNSPLLCRRREVLLDRWFDEYAAPVGRNVEATALVAFSSTLRCSAVEVSIGVGTFEGKPPSFFVIRFTLKPVSRGAIAVSLVSFSRYRDLGWKQPI